jgi:Glyoxalase/Bleomycin resistance protein/Dioxygenase superfamily
MSRTFGPVRQLGYVVEDIQVAMKHWTEVLGVGPFFHFKKVVALDSVYRGQPQPLEMTIALSNSGPLQIELMTQLDGGPSALRDHVEAHGHGLHHLAYWTDAFDLKMAEWKAAGYGIWQTGAIGSKDNRFAYLTKDVDPPWIARGGTVVEISEVSGVKGKLFQFIADSAATWDGTNPIRSM